AGPESRPAKPRREEPQEREEPRAQDEPVVEQPPAADQATDEDEDGGGRRRRRRGRRGRGRGRGGQDGDGDGPRDQEADEEAAEQPGSAEDGVQEKDQQRDQAAEAGESEAESGEGEGSRRRRRRRRRKGSSDDETGLREDDPPNTVVHVRETKAPKQESSDDEVRAVRGSTRLEAKRQRRRDGREAGRRRTPVLSEAEFLARREAVEREMVVRERGDRTQIAVLEDGVLVEHFVASANSGSIVGNVYLGRVQNVLPSMEAAFVDIGRGRNAVLYAGEVDWDAAGLEGKARRIEQALSTGDSVLVQVTKEPLGHKGARLTTQISLPGRFLVYVPSGGATGISRKLPDTERKRLKEILRRIVPEESGVIIRTASEGTSEEALDRDVRRLQAQWQVIKDKAETVRSSAPQLLYEEPDLLVKVVRDLFTEDFSGLTVQGGQAWDTIQSYVEHVAPDLVGRLKRHVGAVDVFTEHRVDEQLAKGLDRKVWLPSGGYLVIDRTEAMTVVDVNTGKFTGSGGNLEETVTRNNLEAVEEIVRQLRLRDIGGIIVIDFIDMVLESNRDLVLRRLTECLGRDRTRHQVAEVTSLGLVQMTRKRVGTGLLEAYSTTCEHCRGRGLLVSTEPVGVGGGNGH
ncbi:Rne/Rng family ribonuclease, partial [Actinoalloteichus caeruleus]|uniref:Rne/Rng family ribonuclease n=1 Tax=Actinoalloteichus cyanogriseus TaxID=2893586 RepID=UPI00200DAD55